MAQIKKGLGIRGVHTTEASFTYRPTRKTDTGAQIDLLIDRADNCITLCEIKYYDSEFVIDKSYAQKIRKKRDIFRKQTRTRKTIFIVMVTTYGTKENQYFNELISEQLTMDVLFLS